MFSLRIVTVDHYQSHPLKGFDVTYSDFRGCETKQVPVIRVFGVTPAGQKACIHIHGVFPYISIPYEDDNLNDALPLRLSRTNKYMQQLALSIDRALNVAAGNGNSHNCHVYKISLFSATPFYGYHCKEQPFLRIFFYNPHVVKTVVDLLNSGAIMNKLMQPHEAHIPFILQFFVDYNLYGMNMINLKEVKFRRPNVIDPRMSPSLSESQNVGDARNASLSPFHVWNVEHLPEDLCVDATKEKMTTCELEVDCTEDGILNRLQAAGNKNPGLSALWTEERQRLLEREELIRLTPPASQERINIQISESEQRFLNRLEKFLSPLQESSTCKNVERLQSDDKTRCNNNNENAAAASKSQVLQNEGLCQSPSTEHEKGLHSQLSNLLDTQDLELIDAAVYMVANELPTSEDVDADSVLSTQIVKGSQEHRNNEDDDDFMTLEMSQIFLSPKENDQEDADEELTKKCGSFSREDRKVHCSFSDSDVCDSFTIPQLDGMHGETQHDQASGNEIVNSGSGSNHGSYQKCAFNSFPTNTDPCRSYEMSPSQTPPSLEVMQNNQSSYSPFVSTCDAVIRNHPKSFSPCSTVSSSSPSLCSAASGWVTPSPFLQENEKRSDAHQYTLFQQHYPDSTFSNFANQPSVSPKVDYYGSADLCSQIHQPSNIAHGYPQQWSNAYNVSQVDCHYSENSSPSNCIASAACSMYAAPICSDVLPATNVCKQTMQSSVHQLSSPTTSVCSIGSADPYNSPWSESGIAKESYSIDRPPSRTNSTTGSVSGVTNKSMCLNPVAQQYTNTPTYTEQLPVSEQTWLINSPYSNNVCESTDGYSKSYMQPVAKFPPEQTNTYHSQAPSSYKHVQRHSQDHDVNVPNTVCPTSINHPTTPYMENQINMSESFTPLLDTDENVTLTQLESVPIQRLHSVQSFCNTTQLKHDAGSDHNSLEAFHLQDMDSWSSSATDLTSYAVQPSHMSPFSVDHHNPLLTSGRKMNPRTMVIQNMKRMKLSLSYRRKQLNSEPRAGTSFQGSRKGQKRSGASSRGGRGRAKPKPPAIKKSQNQGPPPSLSQNINLYQSKVTPFHVILPSYITNTEMQKLGREKLELSRLSKGILEKYDAQLPLAPPKNDQKSVSTIDSITEAINSVVNAVSSLNDETENFPLSKKLNSKEKPASDSIANNYVSASLDESTSGTTNESMKYDTGSFSMLRNRLETPVPNVKVIQSVNAREVHGSLHLDNSVNVQSQSEPNLTSQCARKPQTVKGRRSSRGKNASVGKNGQCINSSKLSQDSTFHVSSEDQVDGCILTSDVISINKCSNFTGPGSTENVELNLKSKNATPSKLIDLKSTEKTGQNLASNVNKSFESVNNKSRQPNSELVKKLIADDSKVFKNISEVKLEKQSMHIHRSVNAENAEDFRDVMWNLSYLSPPEKKTDSHSPPVCSSPTDLNQSLANALQCKERVKSSSWVVRLDNNTKKINVLNNGDTLNEHIRKPLDVLDKSTHVDQKQVNPDKNAKTEIDASSFIKETIPDSKPKVQKSSTTESKLLKCAHPKKKVPDSNSIALADQKSKSSTSVSSSMVVCSAKKSSIAEIPRRRTRNSCVTNYRMLASEGFVFSDTYGLKSLASSTQRYSNRQPRSNASLPNKEFVRQTRLRSALEGKTSVLITNATNTNDTSHSDDSSSESTEDSLDSFSDTPKRKTRKCLSKKPLCTTKKKNEAKRFSKETKKVESINTASEKYVANTNSSLDSSTCNEMSNAESRKKLTSIKVVIKPALLKSSKRGVRYISEENESINLVSPMLQSSDNDSTNSKPSTLEKQGEKSKNYPEHSQESQTTIPAQESNVPLKNQQNKSDSKSSNNNPNNGSLPSSNNSKSKTTIASASGPQTWRKNTFSDSFREFLGLPADPEPVKKLKFSQNAGKPNPSAKNQTPFNAKRIDYVSHLMQQSKTLGDVPSDNKLSTKEPKVIVVKDFTYLENTVKPVTDRYEIKETTSALKIKLSPCKVDKKEKEANTINKDNAKFYNSSEKSNVVQICKVGGSVNSKTKSQMPMEDKKLQAPQINHQLSMNPEKPQNSESNFLLPPLLRKYDESDQDDKSNGSANDNNEVVANNECDVPLKFVKINKSSVHAMIKNNKELTSLVPPLLSTIECKNLNKKISVDDQSNQNQIMMDCNRETVQKRITDASVNVQERSAMKMATSSFSSEKTIVHTLPSQTQMKNVHHVKKIQMNNSNDSQRTVHLSKNSSVSVDLKNKNAKKTDLCQTFTESRDNLETEQQKLQDGNKFATDREEQNEINKHESTDKMLTRESTAKIKKLECTKQSLSVFKLCDNDTDLHTFLPEKPKGKMKNLLPNSTRNDKSNSISNISNSTNEYQSEDESKCNNISNNPKINLSLDCASQFIVSKLKSHSVTNLQHKGIAPNVDNLLHCPLESSCHVDNAIEDISKTNLNYGKCHNTVVEGPKNVKSLFEDKTESEVVKCSSIFSLKEVEECIENLKDKVVENELKHMLFANAKVRNHVSVINKKLHETAESNIHAERIMKPDKLLRNVQCLGITAHNLSLVYDNVNQRQEVEGCSKQDFSTDVKRKGSTNVSQVEEMKEKTGILVEEQKRETSDVCQKNNSHKLTENHPHKPNSPVKFADRHADISAKIISASVQQNILSKKASARKPASEIIKECNKTEKTIDQCKDNTNTSLSRLSSKFRFDERHLQNTSCNHQITEERKVFKLEKNSLSDSSAKDEKRITYEDKKKMEFQSTDMDTKEVCSVLNDIISIVDRDESMCERMSLSKDVAMAQLDGKFNEEISSITSNDSNSKEMEKDSTVLTQDCCLNAVAEHESQIHSFYEYSSVPGTPSCSNATLLKPNLPRSRSTGTYLMYALRPPPRTTVSETLDRCSEQIDSLPERSTLWVLSPPLSELSNFQSVCVSRSFENWQQYMINKKLKACEVSSSFSLQHELPQSTLKYILSEDQNTVLTPCLQPPTFGEVNEWTTKHWHTEHFPGASGNAKKNAESKVLPASVHEKHLGDSSDNSSMGSLDGLSPIGQPPGKFENGTVSHSTPQSETLILTQCELKQRKRFCSLSDDESANLTKPNKLQKTESFSDSEDNLCDILPSPNRILFSTSPSGIDPKNKISPKLKKQRLSFDGFVNEDSLLKQDCKKNSVSPQSPSQRVVSLRRRLLQNRLQNQVLPKKISWNSSAQIDGPTLKNSHDFQCTFDDLAETRMLHEYQYLSVMSLEVHCRVRGDLKPNPECDPIIAVFYCIHNDVPNNSKLPQEVIGMIVADFTHNMHNNNTEGRGSQNSSCTGSCSDKWNGDGAGKLKSDKENAVYDAVAISSCGGSMACQKHVEQKCTSNTCTLNCLDKKKWIRNKRQLLASCGISTMDITVVNDEQELLHKLVDVVARWNPDMVMGYEIELLSWGYVLQRGAHLKMNLRSLLSRVPADKLPQNCLTEDRDENSEIHLTGRVVLNVWRILRAEVTLNMYSFENVFYHVLHQRVPLYKFSTLMEWFSCKKNRWRVVNHYITRVKGTLQLLEHLNVVGRTSELARVFGIQFYEVFSRGSQFRVESLLFRSIKPLNYVAVSPSVNQRSRARAPEFLQLILEPESRFYTHPVVVLDFQSLYPSIMIAYNYCYSTCLGRIEYLGRTETFEFGCTSLTVPSSVLMQVQKNITISPCGVAFVKPSIQKGVLPQMLEEILTTRIMVKNSMKRYKNEKGLHQLLDARQLGLKLISNVTYGYTAANFSGRMPCVEVADSIVSKGRETLEQAIQFVEASPKWKARVVYGDTDSMFVLLAGRSKEEAFKIGEEIAEAVTDMNPKPIKLKFEKIYLPCILQTKKRYVGFKYETPEQLDPVYEAKGIETVRRDFCPAVSKILEKSLRIIFLGNDVSNVKEYLKKQFQKILTGRVSIQDCIFAKEYRGLYGYKPGACIPSLEIARKLLAHDPRSEPRIGERVPYVIVYGSPGLPLIRLVRQPQELLEDKGLRINGQYYIQNVIIPSLNRVLSLIGVNVMHWHKEMPRPTSVLAGDLSRARTNTISQYFPSENCPICKEPAVQGFCSKCFKNPQQATTLLNEKIRKWQRTWAHLQKICQSCTGICDIQNHCISLDCPVIYRLYQVNGDLTQTSYLHQFQKKFMLEF